MFLCTTPPYEEASKAALSRWVEETLANAGIDTRVFKAHSVRGSSTSKLGSWGIPVRSRQRAPSESSTEGFCCRAYRTRCYNFVNSSNSRSCGRLAILEFLLWDSFGRNSCCAGFKVSSGRHLAFPYRSIIEN